MLPRVGKKREGEIESEKEGVFIFKRNDGWLGPF
jgi:hypothetical protein